MNFGSTLRFQLVDNEGNVYAERAFTLRQDQSKLVLTDAIDLFQESAAAAVDKIIKGIRVADMFKHLSDEDVLTEVQRRGLWAKEVVNQSYDSFTREVTDGWGTPVSCSCGCTP